MRTLPVDGELGSKYRVQVFVPVRQDCHCA